MPAALREHQHELLDVAETGGIVFGTEDTGYLTMERPAYTSADMRLGDVDRVQEDGRGFGRDNLGGKSVTFTIGVLTDKLNGLDNGDPHRANLDASSRLEGWWRDPRWRNNPNALAVLRSCEAGQTWRAYGRPRRYEDTPGKFTVYGYTPLVCDFALVDDCYYSDAIYSVQAGLVPPSDGGLVAPLIAPLTTIPETAGNAIARVEGDRPTWTWVTFTGPVTNPSVVIGSLFIGVNATLLNGQSVTVDTRPWNRTVLRENGGNVAGSLNPSTPPLRNCQLRPGDHDILFRGIDATATSRCIVSWRHARSHP
jgi:hypothetical protein